jgi:phenylacetate-CoA ligase
VLAAAEPIYSSTRDVIFQAFQAPLFDTYGSRDFMSIAAECEEHDGLHIHAENLMVETETEKHANGAGGQILVTDLHNYGMPFIRYRIGDLGSLSDSDCPCGRQLPRISRIEGRVLEVLRTAEGRTIPGEFFPHLMKEFGEVQEYQVQQRSLEEVVLSVVLARPFSESSESLLRQEMSKVFTQRTRVTINRVKTIPKLPSGKRRLTIGIS